MSLPSLLAFRPGFVLLISENNALLLDPEGRFESAPGHTPAAQAPLLRRLAAAPNAEVLILIDTLAQSFRLTPLPRLGARDRKSLIARRLTESFPDVVFKAGLTTARDEALLVALHDSPTLAAWDLGLAKLSNPRRGKALLPLEASGLARALDARAGEGWHLLLALDPLGGCRQIVTRDGRFVFTRLTALPEQSASLPFLAAALACDLDASRAYLARFGLDQAATLPMTALIPEELCAALPSALGPTFACRALTPARAAERLHLGVPPDALSAERLLTLWIARRRLTLAFLTPPEKTAARRRLIAAGLRIVSVLGALALGLGLTLNGLKLAEQKAAVAEAEQTVAQQKTIIAAAHHEAARRTGPLARLRAALVRDRVFAEKTFDPRPSFALLPAADPEACLVALVWQQGTPSFHATYRFPIADDPVAPTPRARAEAWQARLLETGLAAVLTHAPVQRTQSETPKDQESLRQAEWTLTPPSTGDAP
jgi:hypothetical protein